MICEGEITRSIVKIMDNLDVEEHPVGMAYKQITEGYLNYVGESVFLVFLIHFLFILLLVSFILFYLFFLR